MKRRSRLLSGSLLLVGFLHFAPEATAVRLPLASQDLIELELTTRLGPITATGRVCRGEAQGEIDLLDPSRNPQGQLVMDVSRLDLGDALKNRAMRSSLEVESYPTASFRLKSLKAPKLVAHAAVDGVVRGEFTLHGVTGLVTAPVSLTYRPNKGVDASIRFKIKPSDYQIRPGRSLFGLPAPDELDVVLHGVASSKVLAGT